MFFMNKSKSNMNINIRKNSADVSVKKGSIDFLYIDNSHLNFISTDVSFSRLYMLNESAAPLIINIASMFI